MSVPSVLQRGGILWSTRTAKRSWEWARGPTAESGELDCVGEGVELYVRLRSSCQLVAGGESLMLMGEDRSNWSTSMGVAALLAGG